MHGSIYGEQLVSSPPLFCTHTLTHTNTNAQNRRIYDVNSHTLNVYKMVQ